MPDLEALREKYHDQGFEIVGIVTDINKANGYDEEALENAKSIQEATGAAFTSYIGSRELIQYADIPGTPTTYFIDAHGNRVGEPVLGAKKATDWEQIIVERLG